jgi:hypothetical protein
MESCQAIGSTDVTVGTHASTCDRESAGLSGCLLTVPKDPVYDHCLKPMIFCDRPPPVPQHVESACDSEVAAWTSPKEGTTRPCI